MNKPRIIRNVLLFALLVAAFGISYKVTGVDFPRLIRDLPKGGPLLKEFLSPNVFSRDVETRTIEIAFPIPCESAPAEAEFPTSGPRLVPSANCAEPREKFILEGFDLEPNSEVVIRWDFPDERVMTAIRTQTDANGYFKSEVEARPIHDKALTTGCSMGAFHSVNFFFRHPDCFDGCIAHSGLFRLNHFIGDYMNDTVYFNTPLAYLPNMNDPWFLDQYRQSQIVICVGQGAWEDGMRVDTAELRRILAAKDIPAWIDFWGYDVDHDWPWWRVQMPYFLHQLGL